MYETKKSIESEISRVVSDYEEGLCNGDDLHDMLVKIMNNWEDVITAQD